MTAPRVFTYWTGPKTPLIQLCLDSMVRNIPDIEIWTKESWWGVYDGSLGPWSSITHRMPNVQSDILRYWLLSHYGGIWLDADYIAFRDIRPIWNASKDYIGYKVELNNRTPYTAVMAAPLGSPIVHRQCEMVTHYLKSSSEIGNSAGPLLTRAAIGSVPDADIKWVDRRLLHAIRWIRYLKHPATRNDPLPSPPDAYGLMLIRKAVMMYRHMSRATLLAHPSIIGQALRRAFPTL